MIEKTTEDILEEYLESNDVIEARKVLASESYSQKRVTISDNIVLVTNTTEVKDGKGGFTACLDFSALSREQLITLTANSAIIASRSDWRDKTCNHIINNVHLMPITYEVKEGRIGRKAMSADSAKTYYDGLSEQEQAEFRVKLGI